MREYEQLLIDENRILDEARKRMDELKLEVSQITLFRAIVALAVVSLVAATVIILVLNFVAVEYSIGMLYAIYASVFSAFLAAVLAAIWWANFRLLANIDDERQVYSDWIMARRRIDDLTLELVLREREELE